MNNFFKTNNFAIFFQKLGECFVGDRLHWTNFLKPYNDDKLKSNIKLSSVNINYDANVWDWDLVNCMYNVHMTRKDPFLMGFLSINRKLMVGSL